jgi:hypothetical protein
LNRKLGKLGKLGKLPTFPRNIKEIWGVSLVIPNKTTGPIT